VGGSSTIGTGVQGFATGMDSVGVLGNNSSENGIGVYATCSGKNEVGIYASSANNNSLYVVGNATVTGSVSKGGGSFKIDHPLDPGGKYLYHSFVESPDMMNVYNGTVTLDGRGEATVELPDWFEALNRDYRYQLTALLGAAPDLHISALVADGKFSISGGKAGQQVSWQVTGIRHDAWANANRIPVEVEKPEQDHGRYLHPELFGGEAITCLAKARDRSRRGRHTTPA
jgi:trimeric autotransporter adhesin